MGTQATKQVARPSCLLVVSGIVVRSFMRANLNRELTGGHKMGLHTINGTTEDHDVGDNDDDEKKGRKGEGEEVNLDIISMSHGINKFSPPFN